MEKPPKLLYKIFEKLPSPLLYLHKSMNTKSVVFYILFMLLISRIDTISIAERQNLDNFLGLLGLSSTHPCGGGYIICDQDHILQIRIPYGLDRNREGEISHIIDQFPALELLEIKGGTINGPLPNELFSLPTLKSLILEDNNLNIDIPDALYTSYLERVYINGNGLTGTISPNISNMAHLEHLSLINNQLTGEIPHGISLLNIYELRLGGNYFTGISNIDKSSGDYPELQWIDISNNCINECVSIQHITGVFPSDNNPFNRIITCSTPASGANIPKCIHIIEPQYISMLLANNVWESSQDIYIDEGFEILADTKIHHHDIYIKSDNPLYFYNRGLDEFIVEFSNIYVDVSDTDYDQLMNGISKQVVFYSGHEDMIFDTDSIIIHIIYEDMSIDDVMVTTYSDGYDYIIEYKFSSSICIQVECMNNVVHLEESDYIEINENVILSKDNILKLTNPTNDSKIRMKDEHVIDIQDSKIEVSYERADLIREINKNSTGKEIIIIEGNYRGKFSDIIVNVGEGCERFISELHYQKNLSLKFMLDDTDCSGIQWYIILVIVISAIVFVIVIVILLAVFVKPVRYCIFPFMKRSDKEGGKDTEASVYDTNTSQIYLGKTKVNPIQ